MVWTSWDFRIKSYGLFSDFCDFGPFFGQIYIVNYGIQEMVVPSPENDDKTHFSSHSNPEYIGPSLSAVRGPNSTFHYFWDTLVHRHIDRTENRENIGQAERGTKFGVLDEQLLLLLIYCI